MNILMIFAHPDDETFMLGGTIIKLTRAGHSVNLITATKGEAGLPGTPAITTMEELPKVREEELRNACKVMGIKNINFLGFTDGTLHKISMIDMVNKIYPIMSHEAPEIVITFDVTGGTNHPDHKAIGKAATLAFQKYLQTADKHVRLYHTAIPKSELKKIEKAQMEYDAFGKMEGTSDEDVTTVIDIKNEFAKKVEAMKMHKTQNKDYEQILARENVVDLNFEYLKLVIENSIV